MYAEVDYDINYNHFYENSHRIFKFKMKDGVKNIGFAYNLTADCPMFVKLCVKTHIQRIMTGRMYKVQTLQYKMADDRHLDNRYIAIIQ